MSAGLLLATLAMATPLALAALGGILSERGGIVNIALEGMMLTGAFIGMWCGQAFGLAGGVAAAALAGAMMGALHYVLTQKLRTDQIISGVAINLLAVNGTTFLVRQLFNSQGREASVAASIPVGAFEAATAALAAILHIVFSRTRFGLQLSTVGENPESARMSGIDTARMRLAGVTLSGILASLAGAYLAISQTTRFSDNMVNGRGFIALAAVVCGRWRPIGASIACLAFGFFDALQIQLQGRVRLPAELLQMMPYLFTILAAMLLKPSPPASLGRPDD